VSKSGLRILVVGNGGREHALAWALGRSPHIDTILAAPGNAGIPFANRLLIPVHFVDSLVAAAREQSIDLVVVGPEVPLALGLADALTAAGVRVFGPSAEAAQIEASKSFAKALMDEAGIPTARYSVFDDFDAACDFIQSRPFDSPGVVVKADGLAGGKGVFVCDDFQQAEEALKHCIVARALGDAGARVVIEERLGGREVSALAFCDGQRLALFPPARDHKRLRDGDTGPNTGGMGAIAPAADVSPALMAEIERRVLQPCIDTLRAWGTPFVGVLFAGLMLTPSGIQTLEFNCRLGDPEAQTLLPLLDCDLVTVIQDCIDGKLDPRSVRWRTGSSATVVFTAPGYPGDYVMDMPISGLDAATQAGATVFHAGTALETTGGIVTCGGRVLAVTALEADLDHALRTAYTAASKIHFEGAHYRRDIGKANA